MASWIDTKTGNSIKLPSTIDPHNWVSYRETYYGVNCYGPVIRWRWKTASIKAVYFIGNTVGYVVDAIGRYCDVLVAIEAMEDRFGAVDLKPKLKVPTLASWVKTNVLEFFKTRFGQTSKPILVDEDIETYLDSQGIQCLIFKKKMGLEKSIRKAMEVSEHRFNGLVTFRFDGIETNIYSNDTYASIKARFNDSFRIRYPLRTYISKNYTSI